MKNDNSLNYKNTNISSEQREAYELKRKAESKLNPGCCLDTICSSRKSRYYQSCDLYQKSAEKYKSSFQWRNAAECYEKCAEIKLDLHESPLAFYKEIIFCYQKADSIVNMKKILFKMNDYLDKRGEFYEAGKNCENMGINFEKEGQNKEALFYYKEAINYYEKDYKYNDLKINLQKKIAELIKD